MAQNISFFLGTILDAAWFFEAFLNTLAWTILCWQKDAWKKMIPAFICLLLIQIGIGGGLYSLIGFHGA